MKSLPSFIIIDAGCILFAAEAFLVSDATLKMIAALVLIPTLCYAILTWAEISVIDKKRREKSGTLIGAYMLFKGMRLLLTIAAVGVYIYLDAPQRMLFVGNVLGLFLITLLCTSIYHLRAERSEKEQNS